MKVDPDETPSRHLIVGNLAGDVGESDLRRLFSEFGELEEVRLWINLQTGDSRGFAFITFESQFDADRAKEHLHRTLWNRSYISVKYARERR